MPTSKAVISKAVTSQAGQRARRTTQPANGPSRWYPQRKDFKSYQEWDTHYRAFDKIYQLQDQVAGLAKSMKESLQAGGNAARSEFNSIAPNNQVSASHIMGIAVKTTVPKDGEVLTYKADQNQFVFM
jgi:hypothetical protein